MTDQAGQAPQTLQTEKERINSDRALRNRVARVLADREVVRRGDLPFSDLSWAHVDKHDWLVAAADVIDVVADALLIPPVMGTQA